MKRAKSDTEISKRETNETKTEIKRETKETQTEIKRPCHYQTYEVTEQAFTMELRVESKKPIPCSFWRQGKLQIAIKENDTSSYNILTTIPLRLSTCNRTQSWTFQKDRKVELDLRLKYKDKKGQVHHASKQQLIDNGSQTVKLDKLTETHDDQDDKVPKWAFVLFDLNGKTKHVRSKELSSVPKKNAEVYFVTNKQLLLVEVLEVAETKRELDIFKIEIWSKSEQAKSIATSIKIRPTWHRRRTHFLRDFSTKETAKVSTYEEKNSESQQSEVVEFVISITKSYPDVKYQRHPTLCDAESKFVEERRKKVSDGLKHLKFNIKAEKVPNIAIIGSGGGMRAVIGMGAALDQLKQEGILDCAMYVAGLSGSAWYLLTLYAQDEKVEPAAVNDHIQSQLKNKFKIFFIMAKKIVTYYMKSSIHHHGEYVTLTNLFGEMIGELLLDKNYLKKWSEQAQKLEHGCNPMPLISAVNVKDEKIMSHYNEWVEFSPYQVFIPRLGAAIKMENFGDQFQRGFCLHKYEEQPIHFLQGICGSAYAKARDYRPQGYEWYIGGIVEDKHDMKDSRMWSLFNKFDSAFVAKVPNFLLGVSGIANISEQSEPAWGDLETTEHITSTPFYHTGIWHIRWRKFTGLIWRLVKGLVRTALTCITLNHGYENIYRATGESHDNRMLLVDAGIAFNSPYPSVLHPDRKIDIILSFDFSDRGEDTALPFEELKKAEKWAKEKGVPFPELYPKLHTIEGQWENGNQKEVYIFSDAGSPTIVHFVMINKSFRLVNDSISENFDEILENERIDLMTCSVIQEREQKHINACSTLTDKTKAVLESIIKQRNPALKHLVPMLETACIEEMFEELMRWIPINDMLIIMEKGSVISANEKRWMEEDGIQPDELLDIMRKRRDPAFKQLEILQKKIPMFKKLDPKTRDFKQLLEMPPKSFLVETFDDILIHIGIQKMLKEGCAEDKYEIGIYENIQKILEKVDIAALRRLCEQLTEQARKHTAFSLFPATHVAKEDSSILIKDIYNIVEKIGMLEIMCDVQKSAVILPDRQITITGLNEHGVWKQVLLEILEKQKTAALKWLVKTLLKQKCDYQAFALLYSPDFENKDSVTEIFKEIQENQSLKDVLIELERVSAISRYEKYRIEQFCSIDDQTHAILKILTSRKDPALKHLMMNLKEDILITMFENILEESGMEKIMRALKISKGQTDNSQHKELLQLMKHSKSKENVLEQFLKILPKNTISKILDEIFENGNVQKMLWDIQNCKWISIIDQLNMYGCYTPEEQKYALYKIILKWRDPKQLLKNLQDKDSAPNNFDILPDYGTLRFSYSEEEFYKFNSLVKHNVKTNMGEIMECIMRKVIE